MHSQALCILVGVIAVASASQFGHGEHNHHRRDQPQMPENNNRKWNTSLDEIIHSIETITNNSTDLSYYVSVRLGLNERVCAGTILAEHWVLTAASCRNATSSDPNVPPEPLVVAVDSQSPPRLYAVQAFVPHPEFNALTLHNDIAMLLIHHPIRLNGYFAGSAHALQVAPLDPHKVHWMLAVTEPDRPAEADAAIAAASVGVLPSAAAPKVRKLTLMVSLPHQFCTASMPATDQHLVHEETVCAFPDGHVEGECRHEIGGAVLKNGSLVAIGARQQCLDKRPELMTRLSGYVAWIEATIAAHVQDVDMATAPSMAPQLARAEAGLDDVVNEKDDNEGIDTANENLPGSLLMADGLRNPTPVSTTAQSTTEKAETNPYSIDGVPGLLD